MSKQMSIASPAPYFSVVVTVFNQKNYLRRAVSSVLEQTFTKFELIVVDDGSTDGSADTISDIGDERLHVLRQENQGVGAARNAGIKRATAPWIAFLDGDDFWLKHHLKELKRASEAYPAAVMVSAHFKEMHQERVSGFDKNQCYPSDRHVEALDYFTSALSGRNFMHTTCLAVRGDVFQKIGGFGDFRPGQDTEMWVRIALNYPGCPVAVSRSVTSVYVRGTGGVMERKRKDASGKKLPESLSDLSPALKTIDEFLYMRNMSATGSIARYINLYLCRGIRANVIKGERARAIRLARLTIPPKSIVVRGHALLAIAPRDLQGLGYKIYRGLRRR